MPNEDLFPVGAEPLEGLRLRALNQALTQLAALKCKYLVVTPDRKQYWELQRALPKPAKPQRTRAPTIGPYGQGKVYLDAYLGDLAVGEVAVIPHDGYRDTKQMASLITAYLCQKHGKGADGYQRQFIYESFDDRTEVFRMAGPLTQEERSANE